MKAKKYPRSAQSIITWFGLDLTDEQLEKYAAMDEITRRDLKNDCCSDTLPREILVDNLVEDVLGKGAYWPRNMDGAAAARKFANKFFTAAEAKGISFVS